VLGQSRDGCVGHPSGASGVGPFVLCITEPASVVFSAMHSAWSVHHRVHGQCRFTDATTRYVPSCELVTHPHACTVNVCAPPGRGVGRGAIWI
jgi:hypothetical protein